MKTFEQYMRDNDGSVSLNLSGDAIINIVLDDRMMIVSERDSKIGHIYWDVKNWAVALYTMLIDYYGITVRFCNDCGKPICEGMTDDYECYYCSDCMDGFLKREYPLGYRKSSDVGKWGGWIEYKTESGEWEDTGLYETDWDDT